MSKLRGTGLMSRPDGSGPFAGPFLLDDNFADAKRLGLLLRAWAKVVCTTPVVGDQDPRLPGTQPYLGS
jgi:hypothetical protein